MFLVTPEKQVCPHLPAFSAYIPAKTGTRRELRALRVATLAEWVGRSVGHARTQHGLAEVNVVGGQRWPLPRRGRSLWFRVHLLVTVARLEKSVGAHIVLKTWVTSRLQWRHLRGAVPFLLSQLPHD